jgi:hypothetical protein
MIPYWYYLVGLVPILVLMIPNERRVRVLIGAISIVLLFWFWGGFSKSQAVERDFVDLTLHDLGKRIQNGEQNTVCAALTAYARQTNQQSFSGFDFHNFMQERLSGSTK